MSRLVLVVFLLSLVGCSTDRTIPEISEAEGKILTDFQEIESNSKLKIADKDEPGERLLLCLTFIDKETRENLQSQLVEFYHTSNEGNYEPTDPNDESTARLSGEATTNCKGQIYIETILPGDYGSSADNRHIHTTVFGASPEVYDINFKQYSSYMGRNFIEGNDQFFLVDLKKTKEGTLVGFLTFEVKNPL